MDEHKAHPEIIKRLKRANGHLLKVIEMLEKNDPCLEVAQQLHAVNQAITNAKSILVGQHIEDCLDGLVSKSKKHLITEFKEIAKYL